MDSGRALLPSRSTPPPLLKMRETAVLLERPRKGRRAAVRNSTFFKTVCEEHWQAVVRRAFLETVHWTAEGEGRTRGLGDCCYSRAPGQELLLPHRRNPHGSLACGHIRGEK